METTHLIYVYFTIAETLSVSSEGASREKADMRIVEAAARKVCPYTSKR